MSHRRHSFLTTNECLSDNLRSLYDDKFHFVDGLVCEMCSNCRPNQLAYLHEPLTVAKVDQKRVKWIFQSDYSLASISSNYPSYLFF